MGKIKNIKAPKRMMLIGAIFGGVVIVGLPFLLEIVSNLVFGSFVDQYQHIDSFHFWGVRVITYVAIVYIARAVTYFVNVFISARKVFIQQKNVDLLSAMMEDRDDLF